MPEVQRVVVSRHRKDGNQRMLAEIRNGAVSPRAGEDRRTCNVDHGLLSMLSNSYDESGDVGPKRYASRGRLFAARAEQFACACIDARSDERIAHPGLPPQTAGTNSPLAPGLGTPALGQAQAGRATSTNVAISKAYRGIGISFFGPLAGIAYDFREQWNGWGRTAPMPAEARKPASRAEATP